MPLNKHEFIAAFRSLLAYHHSCGIEEYPDREPIESSLEALSLLSRQDSNAGVVPIAPGSKEKVRSSQGSEDLGISLNLAELTAEICRCQNCSLHQARQVSTAGSAVTLSIPVKLMIVGDWLTVTDKSSAAVGELFGRDQDMMLKRMIEAIDLSGEVVFVTNVIKCSIPEMCQPTAEHIRSCSSYLEMQIELLAPQMICSMGIIASRLLTAQARPLSQQRGHFYSYKTGSGVQIPVMPTYHPTFLLQNPEMKQATWSDLQAIKRKLGG